MQESQRSFSHKKLVNEFRTIRAMIRIYCRNHHKLDNANLCRECSELLDYAEKRLLRCPFQEAKPTCGNCTVHCYKKDYRERVRQIMRYSGPRMIFRHPVMAFRHLLAGRREAPKLKRTSTTGKISS